MAELKTWVFNGVLITFVPLLPSIYSKVVLVQMAPLSPSFPLDLV